MAVRHRIHTTARTTWRC